MTSPYRRGLPRRRDRHQRLRQGPCQNPREQLQGPVRAARLDLERGRRRRPDADPRNTIVQTATIKVSPITSRGNEAMVTAASRTTGPIIRRNTIDQGAGDIGWFGIELKQSWGAVIERNTHQGRHRPDQPPRDGQGRDPLQHVRPSRDPALGRRGGQRVRRDIDENTFFGDGTAGVDYAISINSRPCELRPDQQADRTGHSSQSPATVTGSSTTASRTSSSCTSSC